jgi:hypothetical protein
LKLPWGRPPTLPLPTGERKGLAFEGSPPTAGKRFQHRARLYGGFDSRLRSNTRFFGAACVTNRVLGHLASVAGTMAHGDLCACADWLSDLGASLETLNCSIADAVSTGRLTGPGLDKRLVSLEQSVVEQSLEGARTSRSRVYFEVLPALDALLNQQGWLAILHFSSTVRWYRRVLSEVRDELRSPIEFARQTHREKIGLALVGALRREKSLPAMLV